MPLVVLAGSQLNKCLRMNPRMIQYEENNMTSYWNTLYLRNAFCIKLHINFSSELRLRIHLLQYFRLLKKQYIYTCYSYIRKQYRDTNYNFIRRTLIRLYYKVNHVVFKCYLKHNEDVLDILRKKVSLLTIRNSCLYYLNLNAKSRDSQFV